jgi:hypothetical protein
MSTSRGAKPPPAAQRPMHCSVSHEKSIEPSREVEIELYGTPPHGITVDGMPRDVLSFRPDPRNTFHPGRKYRVIAHFDSSESTGVVREIVYQGKHFVNIR